MPYIPKESRIAYDPIIRQFVDTLKYAAEDKIDGHINYVFSSILKNIYAPPSYYKYNRLIGVLECIKFEFYRRWISVYEEQKKNENGDII